MDCQAFKVVTGSDVGPSQTMADERFSLNDDEISQSFVLQPVKDILQDAPLECLSDKCIEKLGRILDFERPVGVGGNYLDLASRLFPDESNDSLKSNLRQRRHPTVYLIKKFCKENLQQATTFKLAEALFAMGRLDAIEDILVSLQKQGTKGRENMFGSYNTKEVMLTLRKRILTSPDAVSHLSVGTGISPESYDTEDSVSTYTVNSEYRVLTRPNYQSRPRSFSSRHDASKVESSNVVFVACASDEIQLCKWLVQWLRKKGFDAQCIDTAKLEYTSHPYQYISNLLMKASNVIIICSPRYKDVVSDYENGIEFDEHDLAVRTVFYAMLDEFYDSGGYSCRYIPLLKPGTSRSCVVNPLRWTNAVSLEKKNKKLQQEFIRRLCKKEKYILEPIGPKPKIEPKRISGNQTGLRM